MASRILFIDGCSQYSTNLSLSNDHIKLYYDTVTSNVVCENTYPRHTGIGYIVAPGAVTNEYFELNQSTSVYTSAVLSFAFMVKPLSSTATISNSFYHTFLVILGTPGGPGAGTTGVCVILRNEYGRLCAKHSSISGTTLGRSSEKIFNFYEWVYIEMKLYLGVAGSIDVYANNTKYISATNTLTMPVSTYTYATYNTIRFQGASDPNIKHCFTDISLKLSTVANEGTILNDSMVETLRPVGNSAPLEFHASVGTNYTCVDKQNWESDAQYVWVDAVPSVNKTDIYIFGDMEAIAGFIHIHAVGVLIIGRSNDIYTHVRGAVDYSTTTSYSTVPNNYTMETLPNDPPMYSFIWEQDPITSLDWTYTNINNNRGFGVAVYM